MEPTTEDLIRRLAVFDKCIDIRYSTSTKKFYVNIDGLEIKKGIGLTSPTEHRDCIHEAVKAFYERLNGETVVLDAMGENRKEYVVLR